MAAALALALALEKQPAMCAIWILEPRQVCFGLAMTKQEIDDCEALIKAYFPNRTSPPFKTLLGGLLTKADMETVTDISDKDRNLFCIVPSHSAQSIKYSTVGLAEFGGRGLENIILGFNCCECPPKIAAQEVSLNQDHADKQFPMPDLTAFLCALIPDKKAAKIGAKLGYVQVDKKEEVLLFKPWTGHEPEATDSRAIPLYNLPGGLSLNRQAYIFTTHEPSN
ncbi:hypothetical protein S40288_09980 [Stachybotrys chartarum IBT 40288]|nr:hypothetical protein S40288_09980 [Stachybotrys chartarum IBT 40288]